MKILREDDRISMNRARVLADAKARCLELAQNYSAPTPQTVHLPGSTARVALSMAVDGMAAAGKATPHDVVVCKVLARVLSGEGYRDGRWSGLDKDECGIHTGVDGEGI